MNLTNETIKFLEPSKEPERDIERVSYPGQDPMRRMFKPGYNGYMRLMPVLDKEDPLLNDKVKIAHDMIQGMAGIVKQSKWVREMEPEEKGFNRTILSIAPPKITSGGKLVEGEEIIVARWGNGHTSPVHGHSAGYMHEEILFGKMRVNTYRIVDLAKRIVRPMRTDIVGEGTFASQFNILKGEGFKRQFLVHNFTSIGFSASMHYLPEHTRDGRDNKFVVEHFEDEYPINADDVTQISSKQGMYLPNGEVVMVRSTNVPEYGDHFIVITGKPVVKSHGLRPQDVAIMTSPNGISLLDLFEPRMGLTLLKLNTNMKKLFHEFHGIKMVNGEVVFPKA